MEISTDESAEDTVLLEGCPSPSVLWPWSTTGVRPPLLLMGSSAWSRF